MRRGGSPGDDRRQIRDRPREAPRRARRTFARDDRGARRPRQDDHRGRLRRIYSRPGLSLRDRQIATVAVLTALGRSSQLPIHLRSSLSAGLTVDELQEVILQTAVLAGFPPAMNAWSTLKTIAADAAKDGA